MLPSTFAHPSLKIALGGGSAAVFDAGVPILAGPEIDDLFMSAKPAGRAGSFTLFKMGNWHLGIAAVAVAPGLARAANDVYRDIFNATGGLHVARIWNYVPAINGTGANGRENYQAFCEGRSRAFEERHGREFKLFVPAASAVGCNSAFLTVVFAAGATKPRHVESPLQVPAYDYPREFGPRSPSFARATIARDGEVAAVFISGTAAIRGHATVGACGIAGQLECTLQNLGEISRACGLGSRLDQGRRSSRHFRVYVRHEEDQPFVAAILGDHLFCEGDHISYLQADICRQPLLVEIEATLLGVRDPSLPT